MAKKAISFALVAVVALLGSARSSGMTQMAAATGPWIATDKADYAPGSTVHITGGNWQPGEAVGIVTNDTLGNTWSQSDGVTADGSGAIVDDVVLPNYFVSDYTVTATAQSGTATTTFTDAVNYQFLGKDGIGHLTAAAEEDLGSVASGSSVGATCPTAGLSAKGTGLGGGQTSSYAITYVSGYGDDSALSSPGTRTQINPGTGTFNGNGATCTSLAISTTGLASGTYHGELQMRNTGGATANTELYFFKFTIAPTQQPTSISAVSGAGTYGGNGSLTATLKSGTTALGGKTIAFTLNGSSVGSATTDAAGIATLGGVSLAGSNAGTQNGAVGASFAGDSGFFAGNGVGNLSVAQATSTTTVSCPGTSPVFDGSAKTPCSATVTGVGGLSQALSVGYSNNTSAGTATASASYAGDANHTGSGDSKTFTIGKASSTTTLSCPAAVTYDGSAKTPCSASATGAGGLNTSVPVGYSNNTGAGTATATATFGGDANHDGSSDSKTFTIAKADQAITFGAPFSATYGQTFQVQPTASSGLAVALSGTAGVCSVTADAIQVGAFDVEMLTGTGTCTLTASQAGDGNYNPAAAVSRDVAAAKAGQSIAFDPLADKTFGDADFAVSSSSSSGLAVALAAAGDCTISGSTVHLANAGSCTITASQGGDGNYDAAADVPRSFTIAKAPSTTTVTCPDSRTYTGSAIEPCSAKTTGFGGLDTSTAVSYSDNVAAGTATASASYEGDDNHTGSSDAETFSIEKAPSTVTVTCPGSRTYSGDPIEPCSAHATGAGDLDVALAVSYTNNVEAGTAGAAATFDGDANHTGNSGSSTFTIEKAPSHVAVACPAGPFVYTGSAHAPCSAKVMGAGGLDLVLSVVYVDNVAAGTATASASYAGDANHTGDSDSTSFTIEKAPSDVDVSCAAGPFTYDGSPHTPCSATVTGAGGFDQPLVVTYSDNTAAGTATASASYDGDANHTGNSGSATFTIDKAASAVAVNCPDSRVYTGSAIAPCTANATGAGGLDTPVTVTYADNVGAGTATALATYAGDANHLGNSGSATFTIAKAPSTVTVTCAAGPFIYNGAAQTPCSAKATGAGGLDETLAVAYTDNTNAGTATASAAYAGDANHVGDSGSKTFTIQKATPTVTVTWNGWTYDGAVHAATGSVAGVGGAPLGSPAFTYYAGSSASGTPLPGPPAGVGTYTVLAAFAGSSNYTAASKIKTVSSLYRWDGFLQPINDTAHQGGFESYFKLGSTVPAKFQLKKADGTVVQAGTVPTFSRSTTPVSCDTQVAAEVLDGDAGFSGSTFRWDGSQYIYNWSTKGLQKGEYRLYATLDDGSKQYVDICLQ